MASNYQEIAATPLTASPDATEARGLWARALDQHADRRVRAAWPRPDAAVRTGAHVPALLVVRVPELRDGTRVTAGRARGSAATRPATSSGSARSSALSPCRNTAASHRSRARRGIRASLPGFRRPAGLTCSPPHRTTHPRGSRARRGIRSRDPRGRIPPNCGDLAGISQERAHRRAHVSRRAPFAVWQCASRLCITGAASEAPRSLRRASPQ